MPNFELKDKRCANCGACVIACADHKNLGTHCDIRKLLQFERGEFPNVEARTLSTSCYHCDKDSLHSPSRNGSYACRKEIPYCTSG